MIGTTLSFKRTTFRKPTATEGIALFVLLSYIVGFIIGLILIVNENSIFINYCKESFGNLFYEKLNSSFLNLLFTDFVSSLPFIILPYVFGTCIIGCFFIPAISVLKGMYDGLIISYIYNTYSLSGMGFSALILAPGNIMFVLLLVLASRESICFSDRVFRNALPKGTSANLSLDFKLYTIRYLIICALTFIAALINSAAAKIFINYFETIIGNGGM